MSHRCPSLEALLALRERAADDPERIAAEACPRCRAVLESYEEFMHDRSAPEGVDLARANERLSRGFERELAGDNEREPADRDDWATHRTVRDARKRLRPFDWLFRPSRFAWGAIGVAMIAVGLYAGSGRWPFAREGDVLRAVPPSESGEVGLALLQPREVVGGIELRWTHDPGADAYRVLLIGPDLEEVANFGPVADTSLVIEFARLPEGLAAGTTLGWQVESQRGGFMLRSSPTGTLRVP